MAYKAYLTVKSGRWIVLTILCFILVGFYLNSTTWFRLKLAGYYTRAQCYDKAISIYKKALLKESVICKYPKSEFGSIARMNSIALPLTATYFKSAKHHIEQMNHYSEPDTLNLQLLDKAMAEYENIIKLYEDYQKTFELIPEKVNDKWNEIVNKSNEEKIETLFKFGEGYIKKKLWQESKYFFTKGILKYMNPIDILEKLVKLYNKDEYTEVKKRIWGNDIFVILEDFEDSDKPVLTDRAKNTEPKINIHTISNQVALSGNFSEYFDLSYGKLGYDYWVKSVKIPLSNPNLHLGVRLFIKSKGPFRGCLKINVLYPKQKVTGVWQTDIKGEIIHGWEERRIEYLYEKARLIAMQQNWDTEGMMIDAIIVDTQGYSNEFYIDDIGLYIINKN